MHVPEPVMITAPAALPVTLDELKAHCREDTSASDDVLTSYLNAAIQHCQDFTGRQFITAKYRLKLPRFCARIQLPRPKLQTVSLVSYVDEDGATQTVSSSVYQVVTSGVAGYITTAYNQSWPSPRVQPDAVTIEYFAGYGEAATDVPEPLKHAIRMLAAHWYEHREAVVVGVTVAEVPMAVNSLLMMEMVNF